MHWFRRTLAGVVAAAVAAATAATALAGPKGPEHKFKDWKEGYWANESMARLHLMGILQGNADGTIAPNRPITHLEAAVMLARYLGLEASGEFKGEIGHPGGKWRLKVDGQEITIDLRVRGDRLQVKWGDDEVVLVDARGKAMGRYEAQVPAWGRTAVAAALEYGFLVTGGKKLNVRKPLTRLEAAMMLVKAAGLDAEARARGAASLTFKDREAIRKGLRGYVALAVENGLITGYPDGTFQPNKPVTRAEWAALLDRFDRGADESPDQRQERGTLTAISQTALTVGGVRYSLSDDVWVFIGGRRAQLGDLHAGDRVLVQLDAQARVQLIVLLQRADEPPETVQVERTGTVAGLDPGDHELVLDTGTELISVHYAAETPVHYSQLTLDVSALAAGHQVAAHGTLSGSVMTADRITIGVNGSTVSFPATFQSRTAGSITFRHGGAVHTFPVSSGAMVSAVGVEVGLNWLTRGDGLFLTVQNGVVVDAELVSRAGVTWTGLITHVDLSGKSLQMALVLPGTSLGTLATVAWDGDTIFTDAGAAADAGALSLGRAVVMTGDLTGSATVEADIIALP